MRKYLYIFKSEVMSNMQYALNLFIGFITHFVMLFIFFNLYRYLYSDPSEVINGYTSNQMIWYIIFTELIWASISGRLLCKKISNDVKSGNIIYNINKPYSYIGYALSNNLGKVFIKSLIYMVLSIILGIIFTSSFPNTNIIGLLLVSFAFFLAVIIGDLITIFIGLLSFIIEDSNPIFWVYSKLLLLLGVLFPVEYFPEFIRPFITYSPIYAITTGPASLFVDFSYSKALVLFISQSIYLVVAVLLCTLMYKKGVKNLHVNGG